MRASRASRVRRGALAASIATFAALMSHVAAGGVPPGWVGIAVPFAISLLICTALAGRRVSLARMSLSVAISHVMYHSLFVLGSGGASVGSGSAHHHGMAQAVLAVGGAEHIHASPAMWVGHAVAGVVTIAALYSGSRMLRYAHGIVAQVGCWLRSLWVDPSLPIVRREWFRTRPIERAPFAPPAFSENSVPRRGPPRFVVI